MMNKNIYFSIIIVSLNTKKKLRNTLESIYKQKIYPKNYEIIVVDGMSIDGTQEEILNRKNKIDKLIIEKDTGIYDAMNKGIKYANGEWIIFLNSGDLFYKNNVLKKIYSYKLSENDVIYGDTIINNKEFKYRINGKLFDKNSINIPFCHQSSFVKRHLLKKYNFDLKYKICSDFNFFIKIKKKNKIFKKINLIISTVEAGGLSDNNRFKAFLENLKIIYRNVPSFKNFFKIIYFFLFLLIGKLFKYFLPTMIINKVLRIKYKKNIIN
tara:strand:- start:2753 stop:3556 length:804 start_codon:yes stop_codon:yes gene_type:complete